MPSCGELHQHWAAETGSWPEGSWKVACMVLCWVKLGKRLLGLRER